MENFERAIIELTDLLWEEGSTEGYLGLAALLQNIKQHGSDYEINSFLKHTESTFRRPSQMDILKVDSMNVTVLSAILKVASLLQDQLENEEVTLFLIYQLSPFLSTHFGDNTELQAICERLWTACSNHRLSITFQDQLSEVNPEYLRSIVDKTINECTFGAKMDLTYLKINDTYQKLILPLCLRSNETFRVIIKWTTEQMVKRPPNQRAAYQAFLNEFLDTLRFEMLNSQFRAMFPSELLNEITILDELKDCDDQTFPLEILEATRLDNFNNFVILASCIPNYNHLLKQ